MKTEKEYEAEIGTLKGDLFIAQERIGVWERLFESTNPTQASEEHKTVLAKRTALQRENAGLKLDAAVASEHITVLRADNELLQQQIRELKEAARANVTDEPRRAPTTDEKSP